MNLSTFRNIIQEEVDKEILQELQEIVDMIEQSRGKEKIIAECCKACLVCKGKRYIKKKIKSTFSKGMKG